MLAVIAGKGLLPVEACKSIIRRKEDFFVISFFPEDNLGALQEHNKNNNIQVITKSYYKAGAVEKANAHLKEYASLVLEDLRYYVSLSQKRINYIANDMQRAMAILNDLIKLAGEYKQEDLKNELTKQTEMLVSLG